ncbi:DUF1566 domain-containing protein [Leptospira sp. WS92.C1]
MKLYLKSFEVFILCCGLSVALVAQTPTSRFTDNEDGTVLDYRTGLLWQKCPAGLGSETADHVSTCGVRNTGHENGSSTVYSWVNALKYCNGSLSQKPPVLPAGKSWRLPNINELKSIVDRSQLNPAMDTSVLLIGGGEYFWSSTTTDSNRAAGWAVNFFYGTSYATGDKDFGYHVRCVSN